jgi:hypothetical protein
MSSRTAGWSVAVSARKRLRLFCPGHRKETAALLGLTVFSATPSAATCRELHGAVAATAVVSVIFGGAVLAVWCLYLYEFWSEAK